MTWDDASKVNSAKSLRWVAVLSCVLAAQGLRTQAAITVYQRVNLFPPGTFCPAGGSTVNVAGCATTNDKLLHATAADKKQGSLKVHIQV